MLSIVIPTIDGREDTLKRCEDAYRSTLEGTKYEIVVVRNERNWPTACNEGYRQAKGDVLHFTADDLEPLPGWHVEALLALSVRDELPAPKVFNYSADGEWANWEDGPDGSLTHFTRIPLMTRSQYERIGPWPEIDYYADLWLSEYGRTLGIETRMIHSYAFVHYWSQVGRIDTKIRLDKSGRELAKLRKEYDHA